MDHIYRRMYRSWWYYIQCFIILAFNPDDAKHFWQEIDLSALYKYDPGYFFAVTLLISIATVMKACIFYLIVKILHDKKLDMSQPFSREVGRFIFNVSYLSLGIGLFSWWGAKYTDGWLSRECQCPIYNIYAWEELMYGCLWALLY